MIISILFLFSVVLFPTIFVGMENKTITLLQENIPAIEKKVESVRTECVNAMKTMEGSIEPYKNVTKHGDRAAGGFFSLLNEYHKNGDIYLDNYKIISDLVVEKLHNMSDISKDDELLEHEINTRKMILEDKTQFEKLRGLLLTSRKGISSVLKDIGIKVFASTMDQLTKSIENLHQPYSKLFTTQLRLCTLSTTFVGGVSLDADSTFIDTQINISLLLHPDIDINTFLVTQSVQSLASYKLYLQEKMRNFIQKNTQLETLQKQASEALEHFNLTDAIAASNKVIKDFFQSVRSYLSPDQKNDLQTTHKTIINTGEPIVLQIKNFLQTLLESITTGNIAQAVQAYTSLQDAQNLARNQPSGLYKQLYNLQISIRVSDLYESLWDSPDDLVVGERVKNNVINSYGIFSPEQKQQIGNLHVQIVNNIRDSKTEILEHKRGIYRDNVWHLIGKIDQFFTDHNKAIDDIIKSLKTSYGNLIFPVILSKIEADLTMCTRSDISIKSNAVKQAISATKQVISATKQVISATKQKPKRRNKILMSILGLGLLSSAIAIYYWYGRPSK